MATAPPPNDRSDASSSNGSAPTRTKSIGLDGKFDKPFGRPWSGNFLSRLTFWQATPLVRLGASRALGPEDLWQVDDRMRAETTWKTFSSHWKAEQKLPLDQASLFRAVRKTYQAEWALGIFLQFLYAILSFSTSVLMPFFMTWLTAKAFPGDTPLELAQDWLGYLYLVDIVFATLLGSLCLYHAQLISFRVGINVRATLTVVAYRKALKLNSSKATGNVINLIAQEAQTVAETLVLFNQAFLAPLQIIAATGLLWKEIGAYALIPVGVFLVVNVIAGIQSGIYGAARTAAHEKGDDRTKLIRELISGIRIVKYMGWEDPLAKNINVAREKELGFIKKMSTARTFTISMMASVPNIGLGLTFFAYSFSVETLTADKVFTALSLLNLLRMPFFFFPMGIIFRILYAVTFERMFEYLTQPELPKRTPLPLSATPITIRNANLAYSATDEPVLRNVSLSIKKSSLTMIVGSVGSGKSTLLQGILGEVASVTQGADATPPVLELRGSVAYVAQEAWICNATVRENILFGKPFDAALYAEVIQAAALQPDFDIMPAGDSTEIGDKGINLSGGQRQRISIARALYQDRDVYFLDDPLSAVDSHVAVHLMEEAFESFLAKRRHKTVLLALNQLQFLPKADNILFLKNQTIAGAGSFEELNNSNKDFHRLVSDFGIARNEKKATKKRPSADAESDGSDSGQELSSPPPVKKVADSESSKSGSLTGSEEIEVGLIKLGTYWFYLRSAGLHLLSLMLLLLAVAFGSQVFYSIWLSNWTNPVKYAQLNAPKLTWQGVFLGVNLAQTVFFMASQFVGVFSGINASRSLHRLLLSRVVRATTSFFDSTPLGRLINRFAKDMNLIDEMLEFQLDQFLVMLFNLLALFAQFAASSPYILIGVGAAAVFYVLLLQYYRKTSIAIQRLESVSRSPIFSHLNESLEGGATIRAYNLQREFKVGNMNLVNTNTAAQYSLRYAANWFGFRLDFLGAIIVLAVTMAIVLLRNFSEGLDVSLAGLALSSTNGLTLILNNISVNFNELEVKMNSVERIEQYNHQIAQEAPAHIDETAPPATWPQKGQIEFKKLSIAYGTNPPVLRKISLKIKPKQKIGLVGRTGSGKSTLVTALFRLVEPSHGSIEIDGVDISSLGLHQLRSKLSIIPQTPTLFIGTVRYNIDPFNESTDDAIWRALERVQLKAVIGALPGGLEAPVEENGQNFSVGQRQLLALARALVRDAPILLLDESTASLSNDSDALIQLMIRENFKDKTIITIAHRLNTIMDSDKVVVLDKGRVAEFDSPKSLLSDQATIFAGMVNATGASSAEHLRKIAFGEVSVTAVLEKQRKTAALEAKPSTKHDALREK